MMLVVKTYGLGEEHVVSTVTDMTNEELAAHGLAPGQVGPYKEDL